MKYNFTEEDKKKVVEFLNSIATKASFNEMNVQDIISFFKLLSHMQTVILPKIDANILEVLRVKEIPKEPEASQEPIKEKTSKKSNK